MATTTKLMVKDTLPPYISRASISIPHQSVTVLLDQPLFAGGIKGKAKCPPIQDEFRFIFCNCLLGCLPKAGERAVFLQKKPLSLSCGQALPQLGKIQSLREHI